MGRLWNISRCSPSTRSWRGRSLRWTAWARDWTRTDFISAAAPYIVEVKGTGRYLLDEAVKRLSFVYDPEVGILAREMNVFKSLGFDPAGTTDSARKVGPE